MTKAAQVVVNQYAYTPFGEIAAKSEIWAQPFTYVGQYGVFQESDNLYYMRARYYDASVGRFVSEDPAGFDGGDVNLYAYVMGNPIVRIDSLGLWYIDINVTGGAGRGGTGGLQIGGAGIYAYAGTGIADGGGVSVTLNSGDPSPGLSAAVTVSGGNGVIGGLVSAINSLSEQSNSVGAGWGVGMGAAITISYTTPLWEFDKSNTCNK